MRVCVAEAVAEAAGVPAGGKDAGGAGEDGGGDADGGDDNRAVPPAEPDAPGPADRSGVPLDPTVAVDVGAEGGGKRTEPAGDPSGDDPHAARASDAASPKITPLIGCSFADRRMETRPSRSCFRVPGPGCKPAHRNQPRNGIRVQTRNRMEGSCPP